MASAAPSPEPHALDIGAERIARVYAQAIIEAADLKSCRDEVIAELEQFVGDVLPKVPRARVVLLCNSRGPRPYGGGTRVAAVVATADGEGGVKLWKLPGKTSKVGGGSGGGVVRVEKKIMDKKAFFDDLED
jgi:hypothetical protein